MEWVCLAILVTGLACVVTGIIVNAVNEKEVKYWAEMWRKASHERSELTAQLFLCRQELKECKEADVQGQIAEMTKIIGNRLGGDFYESRDIAIALHSKGYRLTEEKSNEDKD